MSLEGMRLCGIERKKSMLLTKKNFKYQKKYAYDGNDKYPRYILRGEKISKEQAEKIIVTETESRIFAFNNKIPTYDEFDQDSIKKPLSIIETMDAAEREKLINGTDDDIEKNAEGDNDDWLFEPMNQCFENNTPLPYFIDAKGFVGANGTTYKYPMPFEFIVDHLEYSDRYPFLSYVIIFADYDDSLYEKRWIDSLYPPILQNINQIFEAFTYALYVHDGGLEVVKKDEAIKLYKKYQKQYPNDLIFNRSDYNEYVRDNFAAYDIPLILKNWEIKPKLKKEIEDTYKEKSTIESIDNWIKHLKHGYCDEKYAEYKNTFEELENIISGKKTNLNIPEDIYDELKEYIENVFKYHKRMNKVRDLEGYFKSSLSRNDYSAMRDVIYDYRYDRKIIESAHKIEKKDYKGNGTLSLMKTVYNWHIKMFDELEHVRKGEKTKLKYNKAVLQKLKKYLDYLIAEDGSEIEHKELEKIWSAERNLQLKLDEKIYRDILNTILFTKSSTYDMEKEYRIYKDGREFATSFLKEVKDAVNNKDYELKSIDVKSYIKSYDKLYKEYKTIINNCLIY